jgi:hypothetical protein
MERIKQSHHEKSVCVSSSFPNQTISAYHPPLPLKTQLSMFKMRKK